MNIPTIVRNHWVQTAAISTGTLIGGAVAGYFLGVRRTEKKTVSEVRDFLEEVKDDNQLLIPFHQPQEYVRIIEREGYDTRNEDIPDEAEIITVTEVVEQEDAPVINIFRNEDGDWDWDEESAGRLQKLLGQEPYILHCEEFFNDEKDFHQSTLTYYEGDDILADETDQIIYNHAGLLGDMRFGHGSKDPNVVYIRNEKMKCEWEVLRHTGHYSIEIAGNHLEPKDTHLGHSVLKFKDR